MLYRFSRIMLAAAALAGFLGSSPAVAHDVSVRQAWSRATPKAAKVAGGYLTIENRGCSLTGCFPRRAAQPPGSKSIR